MSWIELVAACFGFVCVWLTVRQNVWCWPTGLVQVSLYLFVFYDAKLYSDFILHIIYVFLQFYGWYQWLHGGSNGQPLSVTKLSVTSVLSWLGVCLLATLALGSGMSLLTDASVPFGDAFTTVASLIAQWLMARKRLESWIAWITVDVVAIGIYAYKGLNATAILYSLFLVLAVMGWFAWRKSYREEGRDSE